MRCYSCGAYCFEDESRRCPDCRDAVCVDPDDFDADELGLDPEEEYDA